MQESLAQLNIDGLALAESAATRSLTPEETRRQSQLYFEMEALRLRLVELRRAVSAPATHPERH
jgi:hypothetical protein